MNWFLLNTPLAAAFFGAWVGIPLWLTFKHRASQPSFSTADAYLGMPRRALPEDMQPEPAVAA